MTTLFDYFYQNAIDKLRTALASNLSKSVTGRNAHQQTYSYSRSPRLFSDALSPASEINRRDKYGRTLLHLIASNSRLDAVDWLEIVLEVPGININLQDHESGWTPLHRALYAGNLVVATRLLAHHDINTKLKDFEGLGPFDLYNGTIEGTNPDDALDLDGLNTDMYTWGQNKNLTLGVKGDGFRIRPERIQLDRQPNKDGTLDFSHVKILDIKMSNLHTAILTDEDNGNVRMCGIGNGGRLGSFTQSQFTLQPISGFNQEIADIALGTDHTVLCTEAGHLYTFGLNNFSQLGYVIEPSIGSSTKQGEEAFQATPKRIVGMFKKIQFLGVGASKYHSAAFTEDSLYTWGKNVGQLGYLSSQTPIQSTPRKCSAVTSRISQVAASEAATVCLLATAEVLVLHRDVNFKLSFTLDSPLHRLDKYRPPIAAPKATIVKISAGGNGYVALGGTGEVYFWTLEVPVVGTAADPGKVKPQRVWDVRKSFNAIADVDVSEDSIIVCTRSGHVYVRPRRADPTAIKGSELRGLQNTASPRKGPKFTRIAHLERIIQVQVNSTGGFAAIRADAPLKCIDIPPSTLANDVGKLLSHYHHFKSRAINVPIITPNTSTFKHEEDDDESIIVADGNIARQLFRIAQEWDSDWSQSLTGEDVDLVINTASVPCHSSILASRSPKLKEILQGQTEARKSTINLGNSSLMCILLLLQFLYTDNVPAIWDSRVKGHLIDLYPDLSMIPDIKTELLELADILELPTLRAAITPVSKTMPGPTLARNLSNARGTVKPDVHLLINEEDSIPCHSSILRVRSDFFAAMFNDPVWTEIRNVNQNINIDMSHLSEDMVEILLRYMYGSDLQGIFGDRFFSSADAAIDYFIEVMAIANEWMMEGLKVICSAFIRPYINLFNVGAIFAEADRYQAVELADCCMQYMVCNMETILDESMLDILDRHLLNRISTFCQQRQLERCPQIRSGEKLKALMAANAEWLSEQDLPKPYYQNSTPMSRRFSKPTSPKMSPMMGSSPRFGSFASFRERRISTPVSPSIQPQSLISPTPSPLMQAVKDDDMFEMDDLVEDLGKASIQMSAASSSGGPWKQISSAASPIPPLDLRSATPTSNRRKSVVSPTLGSADYNKMSQKDRKRQAAESAKAALASPTAPVATTSVSSAPTPAWRPNTPSSWRMAEAAKVSLSAIQNEQSVKLVSPVTSPALRRTPVKASPGPSTSTSLPNDPASAHGAPVITPTKGMRKVSETPPLRQDQPWVNYLSTISQPITPTQSGLSMSSFAHIQTQQQDESDQLRSKKAPKSLAEIQAEEHARKEEAEFLIWFEAESKRLKREEEAAARGNRGGKSGRGGGKRTMAGHPQGTGRRKGKGSEQ